MDYYKNEKRFKGVYSRNNLPDKIKNGAYVINLDERGKPGTHWVALYCEGDKAIYFDSFAVGHLPMEIIEFVGDKDIRENIFRLQHYYSITCGYYCIAFIDWILNGGSLDSFNSHFSSTNFKNNDKIIYKMFGHY